MTRNRVSGDYRRDCQSSFQCGLLLLWISQFAFSSKEFEWQGASCRLTVSLPIILFFYLYTFLRISPKPRSYLYAGKAKYLEGLVVLCGFLVCSIATRNAPQYFFLERSCVEQEIIRRPLTARTAVTTKEKKLVRVMPVR